MSGVTEAEVMARRPHVEPAWVGSRQDRTRAGQPRTSRRDRTYDPCPRPPTAAPLRFLLPDGPQHPLPEVPGQLVGRSPSQAHT
jgi:hypothetical protein